MNILIADDHAMIRNALAFMINAQPDMKVVGDAADGSEVFLKAEQLPIDILLMDISMPPGENGLQTTRRLKEAHPDIKVIVLTMHDEETYIREALAAGADGFILKSAHEETLLEGIRQVGRGDHFYDGYDDQQLNSLAKIEQDPLYESLSKREKELLPLIALGYNNKEIAEKLFISVKTVEVHKANIRKKLKLDNYAGLLQYSLKHHLVDF